MSVIELFRRTSQLMVEELVDRLAAAGHPGLTPAYHPVLENIDRGGTRLTDLAARAGITRQSVSELVAVLERRGYLERRPDPTDGRAQLVVLTAAGRELARRAIAEMELIEARWSRRWRRAGYRGDIRRLLERASADRNDDPGPKPS